MTKMNLSYFLLKHAKSMSILEKYAKPYSSFGTKTNWVQRYLYIKERTEYRKKLVDEHKQKLEQEKLDLLKNKMFTIKQDDHHDPTKEVAGAHSDYPSEDNSPPNNTN